ncbi:MAG: hypothetical protein B0A82_08525 [Alkalinema sp. CACIAM 70d]|nr:MAG: hypothetical protein B0A82_08525 [Alkalinema sp. CACIAM 70d]
MFMRTYAIVVLSVVLQSMAYAQATSPPLDSFASDGLGLLPSSESTALTSQANMGVHSATKIQPFLAPQALRNYKTIFNSSAILANFPMSESEQQKLNLSIDESLGKSRRVSVASLTDAQSALYSAISVKKMGMARHP